MIRLADHLAVVAALVPAAGSTRLAPAVIAAPAPAADTTRLAPAVAAAPLPALAAAPAPAAGCTRLVPVRSLPCAGFVPAGTARLAARSQQGWGRGRLPGVG
ncbi:hypothetical protein WBO52_29985 [Saccharothrix sp. CCNWLW140]|uniref:hypothetical protein n=1 Tax=Saccharothrix sp. CCNWLW140 TaxID=3128895 RepID=UPI00307E407F